MTQPKYILAISIVLFIVLALSLLVILYKNSRETTKTSNNTIPLQTIETNYLRNILKEAKEIYINAINNKREDEIFVSNTCSNLGKSLLLNSEIINNTHIMINGSMYKYIIIHIYDSEHKTNILHRSIAWDKIRVEQEPMNRTITYTGGIPYTYRILINNHVCRATFITIRYVESIYKMIIQINKPCQQIYTVQITINMEVNNTTITKRIWLILMKT